MKACCLALLILFMFTDLSHAQSLENLWSARGLEAQKALSDLNKKRHAGGLTKLEQCEANIEASFVVTAEKEKLLIRPGTSTTKHKNTVVLLPIGGPSLKGGAIVEFSYQSAKKTPGLITFHGTSDDVTLSFLTDKGVGSFELNTPGCVYLFSPKDYFHPIVTAK